jgi:hypothetical protein
MVRDSVDGAVGGMVGGMVGGAVGGAVHGAVDGTVRGAVRGAVGGAVHGAVRGTVRGAVDGRWATLSADDQALADQHDESIKDGWWRYITGWWGWWQASNAFCVSELGACPELAGHIDAWQDACSAGWWYPHAQFTIIVDRPIQIRHERVGPDGWGSHRLHNAVGPAVEWADGYSIWCWRGVRVPEWVVTDPTPERIAAERNTEIRRCAIESFGWERYLATLGVRAVDVAPDPGNPGEELRLYDLPDALTLYGADVRLLVMRNASPDVAGTVRTFAETVPATCRTAIDAVAWQFDVDPDTYRSLARAC